MATSVSAYQPSGGALDGINTAAPCFGKRKSDLKFLVCGKTGVGKSSLINSLVGSNVCKVNDPGCLDGNLGPGTPHTSQTVVKCAGGVTVILYDSPGLLDGTWDDEKHLSEMYDECKDADLILYCMEMTGSRFAEADIQTIEHFTKKFGIRTWEHCILVMMKSNMVRVKQEEKIAEKDYHKRLYEQLLQCFRDKLIEQGVLRETAYAVPAVAAGHYDVRNEKERYIWYVSDRSPPSDRQVDFLAELWVTCFETVSGCSRSEFVIGNIQKQLESEEERRSRQLKEARARQAEMHRRLQEQARQQEIEHKRQLEEEQRKYRQKEMIEKLRRASREADNLYYAAMHMRL